MSLRSFHRVFIVLCLVLLTFMAYWASGRNPVGLVTPWLVYASGALACAAAGYLVWHVRTVRLPA